MRYINLRLTYLLTQLRLMCMERRKFSQTMASDWKTAFVVSHQMPWCALLTAVKNCNKSLEKLQDFFFKTETKTRPKTKSRPRLRPRLSFLSSRRLETKTLVSRTTSLQQSQIMYCSLYSANVSRTVQSLSQYKSRMALSRTHTCATAADPEKLLLLNKIWCADAYFGSKSGHVTKNQSSSYG